MWTAKSIWPAPPPPRPAPLTGYITDPEGGYEHERERHCSSVTGDNVDTDVIIPARYLNTQNPKELAAHCMEDIDTTFVTTWSSPATSWWPATTSAAAPPGSMPPWPSRQAGIACVIAKSFARIFYRNSINIGLPILECPAASEAIRDGDVVSIDFDTGIITDETTGQTFEAAPFPPFIQKIIAAGGLMNSLKEKA